MRTRPLLTALATLLLLTDPAGAGEPPDAPVLVRVDLPAPAPGPEIGLYQTVGFVAQGRGAGAADGLAFRATAFPLNHRVCVAPCAAHLPAGSLLFVNGPEIVRSPALRLPPGGDHYALAVHPGSYPGRVVSIILTVAGLGIVAAGGGLLGDAATLEDQYQNRRGDLASTFDPASIDRRRNTAIGLLIAGGLATLGGLTGILVTRTIVTATPQPRRESRVRAIPGGIAF